MVNYLTTDISESKWTDRPRWGITADGYTKLSGAPTTMLVRLKGESRWRRLMVWQFSNVHCCFLRIKGTTYHVRESSLPVPTDVRL